MHRVSRVWRLSSALVILLPILASPAGLAATKAISVDAAQSDGVIDIILGIDRNPIRWTNTLGLVDLATKFHDLKITHLRTHGIDEEHSHPTNYEGIFPDWQPAWWTGSDAPFDATANYNFDNANHVTPVTGTYTYVYFHSTDGKLDDIVNNDFKPFFRLGLGIDKFNWWHRFHTLGYTYFPNPIPDTDDARRKVAIVSENILRHYNEGWHNGFNHDIEFWEVWNEPDIPEMWAADGIQFRKLYRAIATRFRGTRSNPIRPPVKIGASALAWTVPPTGYHVNKSREYCEDLLSYCNANDVPVDFFSWHHYGGLQAETAPSTLTIWFGGNAWLYLNAAKRVRQALDNNGYPDALSICNEWNSLVNQDNPYHNTNLAAAFTACAFIYMDYADVYMASYFPCVGSWGLWDDYTNYTREAYAYKAFSLLRNDTPERLKVTSGLVMDLTAGTAENFGIMAGRSTDGDVIQVLLADEDQKYIIAPGQSYWLRSSGSYWASNAILDTSRPHYDTISLTLDHLIAGSDYRVSYKTVDSNGVWVESAPEIHKASPSGTVILSRAWSPPAVCLVSIESIQFIPSKVGSDWMLQQ